MLTEQWPTCTCCEQVAFTYPNTDRQILRDITIQCSLNSRIAIIGPNGAGMHLCFVAHGSLGWAEQSKRLQPPIWSGQREQAACRVWLAHG